MKKIKVIVLDLERRGWFRRPSATINWDDPNLDLEYKYLISDDSKGIEVKNSRIKSLQLNADYVVIFAYRIPELVMIEANPSVKFIYVQHGYYPDFLSRNVFGLIKKLDRLIIYTYIIIKFLIVHRKIAKTLDILKLWLRPGHQATSLREPVQCFVFDEHWGGFHKRKLGWKNSQYKNLKYFEPKKIKNVDSCKLQYVAQTLVEDGRLDKNSLVSTLNEYIQLHNVTQLCILAHPRTDESLYKDLKCDYHFEYNCCYSVPTIGHYSSLMLYLAENGVDVSIVGSDCLVVPQDFYRALDRSKFDQIKRYTKDKNETYINEEFV